MTSFQVDWGLFLFLSVCLSVTHVYCFLSHFNCEYGLATCCCLLIVIYNTFQPFPFRRLIHPVRNTTGPHLLQASYRNPHPPTLSLLCLPCSVFREKKDIDCYQYALDLPCVKFCAGFPFSYLTLVCNFARCNFPYHPLLTFLRFLISQLFIPYPSTNRLLLWPNMTHFAIFFSFQLI